MNCKDKTIIIKKRNLLLILTIHGVDKQRGPRMISEFENGEVRRLCGCLTVSFYAGE